MNPSASSNPPDPSPTPVPSASPVVEPMFHAGLTMDEWSRRLRTLKTWPQGPDGLHSCPPLPKGELLPPLELPVATSIRLQKEKLP